MSGEGGRRGGGIQETEREEEARRKMQDETDGTEQVCRAGAVGLIPAGRSRLGASNWQPNVKAPKGPREAPRETLKACASAPCVTLNRFFCSQAWFFLRGATRLSPATAGHSPAWEQQSRMGLVQPRCPAAEAGWPKVARKQSDNNAMMKFASDSRRDYLVAGTYLLIQVGRYLLQPEIYRLCGISWADTLFTLHYFSPQVKPSF